MNKRIIATILVVALAMTSAFAQGSAEKTASKAAAGPIKIQFWHSQDGTGGEITEAQVKAFNEGIGAEKGIHVTTVFQSWPGTESFIAAMASDDVKNMPDVIQLYNEHINIVRDYERVVWAEDFLGAKGASLSKEDLIPNLVSAFSINGRMIAVPYNVADLMLYCNMDYLKAAGFEKEPATIAEMAEMMPVIVEKTNAEYGLNLRFTSFELASFITKIGEDGTYMGDNASGRTGYMTKWVCQDELKAFLNEWQKVVDTGVFKPSKVTIQEFSQGINAMIITSSSNIVKLNDLVGDSFTWTVSPVPMLNVGDIDAAMPSNGALFLIDRKDKARQDAAAVFIEYMASVDAQVMWHEKSGYVPVNVHVNDSPAYQGYIEAIPQLKVPYDALMRASPKMVSPFTPNNDTVEDIIKGIMSSFGKGEINASETYEKLVSGVEEAFADYYRVNPII